MNVLETTNGVLSTAETKTLVTSPFTRETTAYIYLGLKDKKINPDTLLGVTLENLETKPHLVIIAFALRAGANSNGYWEVAKGKYHILAVVSARVKEAKVNLDIAAQAYSLLIVSGADLTTNVRPDDKQSVIVWLKASNIYPTDFDKLDKNLSTVKPSVRQFLGILLNREDLVGTLTEDEAKAVIEAFADKLYPKVNVTPSSGYIRLGIVTYNNGWIESAISRGVIVKYYEVNELILDTRKTVKNNMRLLTDEHIKQLTTMIRDGVAIDRYQYALLLGVLAEKANTLSSAYREPRWRKECRSSSPPTRAFDKLSFGLQIDGNKTEACSLMEKYSTSDPVSLSRAARDRRASKLAQSQDLLSGEVKPQRCTNNLPRDPLDLPAAATVSYLSKGKLYCIPSELYEVTLSTRVNPYDPTENLPISVVNEISQNFDTLRLYKVNPVNVPTFSESLLELKKGDDFTINEDVLAEFAELASRAKVSKPTLNTIDAITGDKMLQTIGIKTPLAELDSANHIIQTVAESSTPVLRENVSRVDTFFAPLRIK